MLSYTALGIRHEISLQALATVAETPKFLPAAAHARRSASAQALQSSAPRIATLVGESSVLRSRIGDPSKLAVVQGQVAARPTHGRRSVGHSAISTHETLTIATETVIAEGLRRDDFAAAKAYGAEVLEEALDGKVLLRVDSVERAFGLVDLLLKRNVGSVSPNFLRRVERLNASAAQENWSLKMIGAAEAWATTRGSADIKIAVLDEGVDTTHPALKAAVYRERDFIGNNGDSAMPDGNDAHGTACAGIIVSRSKAVPGIAPACRLIAARIAMGDGNQGWVFDDFATADAIDWAWREGADVLSNSWGGGAPSDAISRAFARARTQGRGGLGSVVVIAAGNAQRPIDFPGNLPGYVTVGASNPADQRKTKTSSDGENWWGSSYGATLHLLAPGVFIWTTDIVGPAGYTPTDFSKTYNGTSSATPAVAAAAALMLSANPALSASSVRNLLARTAKKIQGQTDWTQELGWGRLDVAKAVAAAKLAGAPAATPKPPAAKKTPAAKKAPAAKKTAVAKKAPAAKTKAPAVKKAAKKAAPRRKAAA
ncbi:S8 family serine peptidase [Pseudorhodoferax sp.]|uniref:S8 family serine peptidase n=1 Tax=Pseudorhodoferax sp. TaxID=1993553 RepID=UPI002DD69897|nr:S8 family serine peptidase [Pseudorhodoferax sp.]